MPQQDPGNLSALMTKRASIALIGLSCFSFSARSENKSSPLPADDYSQPRVTLLQPRPGIPSLACLGDLQSPQRPLEIKENSSTTPAKEPPLPPPTIQKPATRSLLSLATAILGTLGYLHYSTTSARPENRDKHLFSRVGNKLFPNENYHQGNYSSIKDWITINSLTLGTGAISTLCATRLEPLSASSFSHLFAPTVLLAGAISCLQILRNDGKVETNQLLKTCTRWTIGATIGYAAFMSASYMGLIPSALQSLEPYIIALPVIARAVAHVGLVQQFIKAARDGVENFPSLKAQVFWMGCLSVNLAAAQGASASQMIIPAGYFATNAAVMATSVATLLVWHLKRGTALTRVDTNSNQTHP